MSTSSILACVFGNPIEQSKSPIIHNMFARQFGLALHYEKRSAPTDQFVQAVEQFFAEANTIGANVTMPFKHDAYEWVDELSSQAKRAGAVNTIIRTETGFVGDNTDGIGLVNDLQNHGVTIKGANLLLIGAGGAAQGALPALVDAGIHSVSVYNRSIEKAQDLVALTNHHHANTAKVFENTDGPFDIIINATSLSLSGLLPEVPNKVFNEQPAVYDMVYLSEPTVFLQKASSLGCTNTIDGLGMLVQQAAHSFYLWFGKHANTQIVYNYLKTLNKN